MFAYMTQTLKAAKQRCMLIKDNTEFEKLLVSIGS
jgi:hypothetical protein